MLRLSKIFLLIFVALVFVSLSSDVEAAFRGNNCGEGTASWDHRPVTCGTAQWCLFEGECCDGGNGVTSCSSGSSGGGGGENQQQQQQQTGGGNNQQQQTSGSSGGGENRGLEGTNPKNCQPDSRGCIRHIHEFQEDNHECRGTGTFNWGSWPDVRNLIQNHGCRSITEERYGQGGIEWECELCGYGGAPEPEPTCGDNDCNGDEDCNSCSADCGACAVPTVFDTAPRHNGKLIDACYEDFGGSPDCGRKRDAANEYCKKIGRGDVISYKDSTGANNHGGTIYMRSGRQNSRGSAFFTEISCGEPSSGGGDTGGRGDSSLTKTAIPAGSVSAQCTDKCKSLSKSGACFTHDKLPDDLFGIEHNFLIFGNLECKSNEECYCWNQADLDRVNAIVRDVTKDKEIGESCSVDGVVAANVCISGFCNINGNNCYDRCDIKGNNQACREDSRCTLYPLCEGSSCSGVSRSCVNVGGYNQIKEKMFSIIAGGDKATVGNEIRALLNQYNFGVKFEEDATTTLNRVVGNVVINTLESQLRSGSCPDFDGNGAVDFDDFFIFADHYGHVVDSSNERVNLIVDDGVDVIGFDDFFRFADHFGAKNVECVTPVCYDGRADMPGEVDFGDYSCGGDCPCEYSQLKDRDVEVFEEVSKNQVRCDNNGVCEYVLRVKGKHAGRGSMKINILDSGGNSFNEITYPVTFGKGDGSSKTNFIEGFSVFDLTSSAVLDVTGHQVFQAERGVAETGERSRVECGIKIPEDPGFCCPAGYSISSDLTNPRCVVDPIRHCADFNRNGVVNFVDYFMLADSFGKTIGQSGYNGSVDLNEDGAIGFDDFFIFADEFGKDPVCHDTVCTAVYEPVCGRDGITYSNRCKADRAGATVLYSGACGSEVCRPGYLKCADGSCKTSC